MARVAKSYSKPYRRTPKRLKRRDCLRCDRKFWSEGPHHRLCQGCRQSIASSPSPLEEYSLVVLYERGRPALEGMSML
jgi:5-methylcytosine-specific restriction endonuclease McrA